MTSMRRADAPARRLRERRDQRPVQCDGHRRHTQPPRDLRLPAAECRGRRQRALRADPDAARSQGRIAGRSPRTMLRWRRSWSFIGPAASRADFEVRHSARRRSPACRIRSSCTASNRIAPDARLQARSIGSATSSSPRDSPSFSGAAFPDDSLLDLARRGQAAASRRFSNSRCVGCSRIHVRSALVENFAGQWLHLRELRSAEPADREFDENLRQAFQQETQLLFGEGRCMKTAASSSCSTRTTHSSTSGSRVTTASRACAAVTCGVSRLPKNSPRRGLLGQGSILTVTSVGDRTSPVIRGAWVMENLHGRARAASTPRCGDGSQSASR